LKPSGLEHTSDLSLAPLREEEQNISQIGSFPQVGVKI